MNQPFEYTRNTQTKAREGKIYVVRRGEMREVETFIVGIPTYSEEKIVQPEALQAQNTPYSGTNGEVSN